MTRLERGFAQANNMPRDDNKCLVRSFCQLVSPSASRKPPISSSMTSGRSPLMPNHPRVKPLALSKRAELIE